ncbi:MAG: HlyD family efflux transporter periplasmic adaptor subunit [Gemmatimonadota bacterium]
MRLARRHIWIGLTLAAVVAAVLLVMRPDPVSVELAEVDRGMLRVTIDEDGETRVRDRFVISAPVTGRLERLECEVGDTIAPGEVVASVYPLPLDSRARTEAAAALRSVEAARDAAGAAVGQAEELWGEARRSLERLERLEQEVPGSVAQQRLDEAGTAERAAALRLEQARGAAEAAAHDVDRARAALAGAEGSAPGEPTPVRAPAGGRVLRIYEECERTIMTGSPILEIGDPAALEVVVDVLTEDATLLAEGAPALISAGPDADTLYGRIDLVEPSAFTKVSPLGVEEQRVNVVVAFDDAPVLLGDRFRVDASLVAWEASDVVRAPVSALFRSDGEWAVFVVAGNRARLRVIEVGHRGRRHAEVLNGLAEGEEVILFPSEILEDGVRVESVRR